MPLNTCILPSGDLDPALCFDNSRCLRGKNVYTLVFRLFIAPASQALEAAEMHSICSLQPRCQHYKW